MCSLLPPQEGRAYYQQTGVGPLPVVLYNGMPYQRDQLDPDELETVTMHKILETTSFYQRAVYLVSELLGTDGPGETAVGLDRSVIWEGLGLESHSHPPPSMSRASWEAIRTWWTSS